ncbi:hypothetical protein PU629_21460 [Pullulanibacillus sp. KACC 23026]|nr:hypothetical protein [Pullulanibacillus sp. KACC 23026]WEG12619.1 hypothetical protein PU629_21460 [Pullulanibacillus sp. KACC 23026]
MSKAWVPIVASIGIGAMAYQLMKPQNKFSGLIKHRMDRMAEEKEVFPNS